MTLATQPSHDMPSMSIERVRSVMGVTCLLCRSAAAAAGAVRAGPVARRRVGRVAQPLPAPLERLAVDADEARRGALVAAARLDRVVQDRPLDHVELRAEPIRAARGATRAMRSISMRASPAAGGFASSSSVGTSIVSLSASSARRSITLRSSRTLPGPGPALEPGHRVLREAQLARQLAPRTTRRARECPRPARRARAREA